MEKQKILDLVSAGYSKSEIEEILGVHDVPPTEQRGDEAAPDNNAVDPSGAETSNQDSRIAIDTANWLKDFTSKVDAEIDKMKKAYEDYQIIASNNKEEVSKGAIDVFGEIINPPNLFKEKE